MLESADSLNHPELNEFFGILVAFSLSGWLVAFAGCMASHILKRIMHTTIHMLVLSYKAGASLMRCSSNLGEVVYSPQPLSTPNLLLQSKH